MTVSKRDRTTHNTNNKSTHSDTTTNNNNNSNNDSDGDGDSEKSPPTTPRPPHSADRFIAGSLSGCLAAVTLQPFDVIKTRMLSGNHCLSESSDKAARHYPYHYHYGSSSSSGSSNSSGSAVRIARDIVRKEGVKGLWSGAGSDSDTDFVI